MCNEIDLGTGGVLLTFWFVLLGSSLDGRRDCCQAVWQFGKHSVVIPPDRAASHQPSPVDPGGTRRNSTLDYSPHPFPLPAPCPGVPSCQSLTPLLWFFSFPLPATLTASCQGPLYTGLRFSRSICLISSMSAMHTSSDSKERPSRSAKCPEKGEGRTGHLDEQPSFSSKQPVWWQKINTSGGVYTQSRRIIARRFSCITQGLKGWCPRKQLLVSLWHTHLAFSVVPWHEWKRPNAPGWRIPSP